MAENISSTAVTTGEVSTPVLNTNVLKIDGYTLSISFDKFIITNTSIPTGYVVDQYVTKRLVEVSNTISQDVTKLVDKKFADFKDEVQTDAGSIVPVATKVRPGIVVVGDGLNVDGDGIVSVDNEALPITSDETLADASDDNLPTALAVKKYATAEANRVGADVRIYTDTSIAALSRKTIVVYIDNVTGSDMNAGLDAAHPVASVDAALTILGKYQIAGEAILSFAGGNTTKYDLVIRGGALQVGTLIIEGDDPNNLPVFLGVRAYGVEHLVVRNIDVDILVGGKSRIDINQSFVFGSVISTNHSKITFSLIDTVDDIGKYQFSIKKTTTELRADHAVLPTNQPILRQTGVFQATDFGQICLNCGGYTKFTFLEDCKATTAIFLATNFGQIYAKVFDSLVIVNFSGVTNQTSSKFFVKSGGAIDTYGGIAFDDIKTSIADEIDYGGRFDSDLFAGKEWAMGALRVATRDDALVGVLHEGVAITPATLRYVLTNASFFPTQQYKETNVDYATLRKDGIMHAQSTGSTNVGISSPTVTIIKTTGSYTWQMSNHFLGIITTRMTQDSGANWTEYHFVPTAPGQVRKISIGLPVPPRHILCNGTSYAQTSVTGKALMALPSAWKIQHGVTTSGSNILAPNIPNDGNYYHAVYLPW